MLDLTACAECGAVLVGKAFFDIAGGCFTCPDCAKGAGVSESTLEVLKKCAGKPYRAAPVSADGKRRALKLLNAYFRAKTDAEVKALNEYIAMLSAGE